MRLSDIREGDWLTWRHVPRGGYGYVYPVDAKVLAVGPRRVRVQVARRDGSLAERVVRPESLHRQQQS